MISFARIAASSRPYAADDGPLFDPGLTYTGTNGNDSQVGTGDDDVFKFGQGGEDTIFGGAGDDEIRLGGEFTPDDRINGGNGYDLLLLNGDYYDAIQPILGPNTLFAVEEIRFAAGNDYVLTFDDANVAPAEVLTIDASALGVDRFTSIDTRPETDGLFVYKGGAANDALYVGQDGNTVTGGAGGDFIYVFPDYAGATRFDGGPGFDFISTVYSASASVTMAPGSVVHVEQFFTSATVGAGDITLELTLHDGNVAAGETMAINAGSTTGATIAVFYDGSAERDGAYQFGDTDRDDTMYGGKGNDRFDLFGGGDDRMRGGQGNDIFVVSSATLTAADSLDGGRGIADTLQLAGDYFGGLVFGPTTLVGVEYILLDANFSYYLTSDDATVAAGSVLHVDGFVLTFGRSLSFDGSAETDGRFDMNGGSGSDSLIGGSGRDVLFGRGGGDLVQGNLRGDRLAGGNSADTFRYLTLLDSRAADPDTITDFGLGADLIDLSGIDADAATGGDQAFHFGKTPGRTGDITAKYDALADVTVVKLYVNADDTADAVIWLKGDHTLSAADFVL